MDCYHTRRVTNNAKQDLKSWWRRVLSDLTRRFSLNKGTREAFKRRCEISSCKAIEDEEVCPIYVEQLRLLAADATPATSGPARSPDPNFIAFKFVGSVYNAVKKSKFGSTTSRLVMGTNKVARRVGGAVGRKAQGVWRKMRRGAATTSDFEFNNNNSDEKREGILIKAISGHKGGGDRRDGGTIIKPRRFTFRPWRQLPCKEAPAMFNPTSDKKAKFLAAERALAGHNPSALQLSVGVNVVVFTAMGFWCYFKTRGHRQPPWQQRWRRRPEQRPQERERQCSDNFSASGWQSKRRQSQRTELGELQIPQGEGVLPRSCWGHVWFARYNISATCIHFLILCITEKKQKVISEAVTLPHRRRSERRR